MNILVTGGSGMVGRHVVDEFARSHTVEVLDLKPPHRNDLPFHRIDILDPTAISKVVKNFDAVVHLAGIPNPLKEPGEKVFRVNTVGTFNVLDAAAKNGIKKFVLMSSESTLGFAFSSTRMWPEYIPVDEHHPLRPQDSYGLSKVAGELLCAGYSQKTAIQTTCLRAPWIWVPEEKEICRKLVSEYRQWSTSLWAFINVKDVAQAIARTLKSSSIPLHDVFFICADKNWSGKESRSLLAEFYPETKRIPNEFAGDQSLITSRKAKEAFGFAPRFGVTESLQE